MTLEGVLDGDLDTAVEGAELQLEGYRGELTGYCYRMLGSLADAEDAVQDAMVRAWRHSGSLRDASAQRGWLYRIATRVCFDHLEGRRRRALPVDMSPSPSAPVLSSLGPQVEAAAWVEPAPDARVLGTAPAADPAAVAEERESVRLALVAALQLLPPRQRAVLVLREVLHWHADEVARLLGTSVPSVNSLLQRARATLAARDAQQAAVEPLDEQHAALLAQYVDAFERYDVDALVGLLHAEATMSMPPYALWLRGPRDVAAWLLGPGAGCRGSRVLRTRLNGQLALAQYRPDLASAGPGGQPTRWTPWALVVLAVRQDDDEPRIGDLVFFLDAGRGLFERCGLPTELGGELGADLSRESGPVG
ncbi:RNA polymerase subunit sigma-70 [Quadrisphaera oryzae]|uniref:RNA polymerase subunit sigma-70 n=1 Tax=Quadrisphaera TaxID=317661 RepID=UPI00164744E3|nr:RNA polymerase subunit sigma-70 [Quadrisphaera sp. RL12-1S]MBC3763878.1 RNA polymerase subunit sigma-70 [Quadrisphaera sp. RL12-1S]